MVRKKVTKLALANETSKLALVKCRASRYELEIDDNLSMKEWKNNLRILRVVNDAVQFWIGDLINFGREKYGIGYVHESMEKFEYEKQTLKDYRWVAEKVQPSLRKDTLSFSHHKEVAFLETDDEKKSWLDIASNKNLSVRDLRKEIRESNESSNYRPRVRNVGELDNEERMDNTEEFQKFIHNYISDLKKLSEDSKCFTKFKNDFIINHNDLKKWGVSEQLKNLIEELEYLKNDLELFLTSSKAS